MSDRLTRVAVIVAIAAAAAVVTYGVTSGSGGPDPGAMVPAGVVSEGRAWLEIPIPEAQFRELGGGTVRLEDYSGQIVLLNFWGTWCPPCLVEIPHLIQVQKSIGELGATVIGPAIGSGSAEDVADFGRQRGINYPLWLSDEATSVGRFGAPGYPFSVLIDRNGVIRARYAGPRTSATFLRDIRALAEMQPPGE
jgi:thiol-disulfide isomerase/thioredoxin